MLTWAGEHFNPEAFSVTEVNQELRKHLRPAMSGACKEVEVRKVGGSDSGAVIFRLRRNHQRDGASHVAQDLAHLRTEIHPLFG
jgi:hypothetical protein